MTTAKNYSLAELEAALPQMGAKNREFMSSVAAQWATKGFISEKQTYWVNKIVGETLAAANKAEAPRQKIGSMKALVEMFETAKGHLKTPAFEIIHNGIEVRVNLQGPDAKFPGSIRVQGPADNFGSREWYGRVRPDGTFDRGYAAPDGIEALLTALSEDPLAMATEYGKLTGRCTFCRKKLTQEESTDVGYGKKCAANYGLVWGNKKPKTVTATSKGSYPALNVLAAG